MPPNDLSQTFHVDEQTIESINAQIETTQEVPQSFSTSTLEANSLAERLREPRTTSLNTEPLKRMSDITPTAWFIKTAHDRGIECQEYDGFPELRQAVLERTSERIANQYDNHNDWTISFNNETMEWPHINRAYMAAYEARFTERNEDYLDNCRDFAESMDVMEYDVQSDLGWFADNDINPSELPAENVRLALMLSANDDDVTIARDVEDVDAFLNWYENGTSPERAQILSEFGGDLPASLTGVVAPIDEWDTIDPHDIPQKGCLMCGDAFHHIHHRDEGIAWVRHRPDGGVAEIHEQGDKYFANRHGVLCDECVRDFRENEPRVALTSSDGQYLVRCNGRVLADEGDSDFDNISTDAQADGIRADLDLILRNHNDVVDISAHDHPRAETASRSVTEAEQDLLGDAFENPSRFFDESGIFIMEHAHNNEYMLRMFARNVEALRETKQILENIVVSQNAGVA